MRDFGLLQGFRTLFETYDGFKALVFSTILSVLIYMLLFFAFPVVPVGEWATVFVSILHYSLIYWFENPLLGLIVSCFVGAILLFDGLRHLHNLLIRDEYMITPRRSNLARRQRVLGRTFTVAAIMTLFVLVPLLHIHYTEWALLLAGVMPVPIVLCAYVTRFGKDLPVLRRTRQISKLSYPKKSFNVSSLAVQSTEARREVDYYHRLKQQHEARGEEISSYILRGRAAGEWRGLRTLFQHLAQVMGSIHPESLELFDRTTDAILHAVSEVKTCDRSRVVLLSNAEYNSVYDGIKSRYSDSLMEVGIADLLWDWHTPRSIEDKIVDDTCRSLNGRKGILVISHVFYSTGYVLDVVDVTKRIKERCDCVVICDGAQSIGQIHFPDGCLDAVDYFGACTHKWLLGSESLGLLYRNCPRLRDLNIGRRDGGRGLSRLERDTSKEFLGTVNLDPYIAASVALGEMVQIGMERVEEHGRRLSAVFRSGIERRGLGRVLAPRSSAKIVSLEPDDRDSLSRMVSSLKSRGIVAERVGRAPGAELTALRFGFHHYHSDSDVYDLLDWL